MTNLDVDIIYYISGLSLMLLMVVSSFGGDVDLGVITTSRFVRLGQIGCKSK